MKKRKVINNGHLTGKTSKEILEDVLSNAVIYIEARNGNDNNRDCPLNGKLYTDSFDESIIAFIMGSNIKNWTEIPDYYILDSVNRQNFIHYIKWQ